MNINKKVYVPTTEELEELKNQKNLLNKREGVISGH